MAWFDKLTTLSKVEGQRAPGKISKFEFFDFVFFVPSW